MILIGLICLWFGFLLGILYNSSHHCDYMKSGMCRFPGFKYKGGEKE